MDILPGFKLCRKGLHQYPADKKQCPECAKLQYERTREKRRLYSLWWRQQNPELVVKQNKENYEKNKEKIKAKKRERYKNDPTPQKIAQEKWLKRNRQKARENTRRWQSKNKHRVRQIASKRRAAKNKATPKWARYHEINKIYKEAVRLTEVTGIEHQVDHVYPLINNFLCGLHVETNLQILTKKQNSSKGNRTWPGQLDCQKGSVYDIFPKELTDLLDDEKT